MTLPTENTTVAAVSASAHQTQHNLVIATAVSTALSQMPGFVNLTPEQQISTITSLGQGLSMIITGAHPVSTATAEPAQPVKLSPAVPVSKSIQPDYIVCLEDGKKLKMLKRHLMSSFNLTPDQYRARWNLPADYPMVAPNYATQRSQLAKAIGLGTTSKRGRGKASADTAQGATA